MKSRVLLLFIVSLWILMNEVFGSKKSKFLNSDKSECNSKRLRKMDSMLVKWAVFGKGGKKLPENEEQLQDFCSDEFDKFLQECITKEVQSLAKISVYSVRRTLKSYCGRKKSKKISKLLSVAPCINKVVETNRCVPELMNKTKALIPYKIEGEKIKHTCCYFADMNRCLEGTIFKMDCMTSEAQNSAKEIMNSLFSDLVSVSCGDYNEETDRCASLPPPDPAKYNPKDQIDPKWKSFFFVSLFLAESMDNFSLNV